MTPLAWAYWQLDLSLLSIFKKLIRKTLERIGHARSRRAIKYGLNLPDIILGFIEWHCLYVCLHIMWGASMTKLTESFLCCF
jgi:hypothetical protein